MTTARCPVCLSAASALADADCGTTASRMEAALGVKALDAIPGIKYRLRRCGACSLEFADPMTEPGPDFYQWLTASGFNYPGSRWEWRTCWDIIAAGLPGSSADSRVVLDVGSGDGGFLRMVGALPGVRAIGVDHNPDVVRDCRAANLEVLLGGLDAAESVLIEGADVITFWHVVEHVGDPVGLLSQARKMLRSGGFLCFSVPISPMSYEHSWPDPFNEPPHHLTRWNIASLEALAGRLGMSMQLHLPPAEPLLGRVARSLSLQVTPRLSGGRLWKATRLAGSLLARPWRLPAEFGRQLRHPRHAGRVLADAALVCLKN